MLRALYTGVSGLRNHQTELDVVSNNIANINTLGFKSGRVTFKEALTQTIRGASRPSSTLGGTNPQQVGLGLGVASIDNLFTQGQFQSTGNGLDIAIQGDGFFVLSDGSGEFYTRVGAFHFDADGRLVASDGRRLQGRAANPDGTIDSGAPVGDIVVPVGLRSDARATTRVAIAGNLDASQNPTGNVVESRPLLAGAESTDLATSLRNATGVPVGLRDGETVSLVANATGVTRIGQLHTEAGDSISLGGATTITVTDGTATSTITTLTDSSTYEDLRAALQAALGGVAVSIASDGSLQFTNNSGAAVSITASVSGASNFNSLIRDVTVAAGGTNFSERADARTDIQIGASSGGVSTAGELAAGLATAWREVSGAAANVDFGTTAAGRFTFTGGGTAVTGLRVLESDGGLLLATSLGLPSATFGANETVTSGLFLDVASDADALPSLYATDGTPLGVSAGDTLAFAASRGGAPLAPLSIAVGSDGGAGDGAAATLRGLLDEIAASLGLASPGAVSIGANGQIVIRSDPGEANALSAVTLSETSNPVLSSSIAFGETAAARDVESTASITVFDDLGNRHVVSLVFTKDPLATNMWSWQASVAGPATLVSGGSGIATFNPDGTLASFVSSDGSPLTIDPGTGATNPVAVTLDAAGTGPLTGFTQFAAPSEVFLTGQDGYASGVLESVTVDDRGVVTGLFSNGTSRAVAQIVLARFANAAGLLKARENTYVTSANSGNALIVNPGSSGGTLASGALEMSNVDLGQEFTNLIIAQRGFQANARTITTGDEMLTELVNLKR